MENIELKFTEYSIEEFNLYFDTTLNKTMSFEEAAINIEEKENSYFYIAMCEEDIIEAIEDEKEIANQLNLNLICIDEIGIYIALY
jgi:hypothetical protein